MVRKRHARKCCSELQRIQHECVQQADVTAVCFSFMQNFLVPLSVPRSVLLLPVVGKYTLHSQFKADEAQFCLHHTDVARKITDEVCSLVNNCICDQTPNSVYKLRVFSDVSSGHNRNHRIIVHCITLAGSGRFDLIKRCCHIRGYLFCLVVGKFMSSRGRSEGVAEYIHHSNTAKWFCGQTVGA